MCWLHVAIYCMKAMRSGENGHLTEILKVEFLEIVCIVIEQEVCRSGKNGKSFYGSIVQRQRFLLRSYW